MGGRYRQRQWQIERKMKEIYNQNSNNNNKQMNNENNEIFVCSFIFLIWLHRHTHIHIVQPFRISKDYVFIQTIELSWFESQCVCVSFFFLSLFARIDFEKIEIHFSKIKIMFMWIARNEFYEQFTAWKKMIFFFWCNNSIGMRIDEICSFFSFITYAPNM